jgi:hypothetical protein
VPSLISSRERSRPNTSPPLIAGSRSSAPIAVPSSGRVSTPAPVIASDSHLDRLPPRALPGWLVALTFVCLAVFVAGLVVYLRRSEATPAAPPPVDAGTSGSQAAPIDAGAVTPPQGTLLVRTRDGGQFFVDKTSVSLAAFRAVYKNHAQTGRPEDPVVQVTYDEARSFAKTRNARLLTSAEWDAAIQVSGFASSGAAVYEWVESPDKDKTVRSSKSSETRSDGRYKDVTFRMARSAP